VAVTGLNSYKVTRLQSYNWLRVQPQVTQVTL
jgi:hypothetical protein